MIGTGALRTAVVVLCLWTFGTGSAAAETALEMRDHCKAITQEAKTVSGPQIQLPYTFEAGLCWGAFAALQAFSYSVVDGETTNMLRLCVPEVATRKQLVEVFYRYAEAHPERLHEDWHYVAWLALLEAFPCSN